MKIFVYGTLKKGGVLHKYMKGAKFVRDKKLHGYVLYLAPDEKYPLIYQTGKKKDVVVGEIWKIDTKIKRVLDKYEASYILKKLIKSPFVTYYPAFDITHQCKKIPKNEKGKYEFNIKKDFYKGFYSKHAKIVTLDKAANE